MALKKKLKLQFKKKGKTAKSNKTRENGTIDKLVF